jgi:hypothetical protein
MALSNEAAYDEALKSPFQRARASKNATTVVAGRAYSLWTAGGMPAAGAAPTTAAVPTEATAGALNSSGQNLFNGTNRRILKAVADAALTTPGAMITVCDRLSHQGGLSGTTTTAQTTNLPTSALTRYTSGVGVQSALEIYTTIGATGTTVTTSYTDSGSAAGNTSPAATFGGTGNNTAPRFVILPLAVGDVGVKSVESVTVLATTGTAGNFGVTLFYPVISVPIDDILAVKGSADALFGFGPWFPLLSDSACLFFVVHATGTTTGVVQADFLICEDR